MLKVNIVLNSNRQSIKELSSTLCDILLGLSKIDVFFEKPRLRQEYFDDVNIDLDESKEIIIEKLANTILGFSKKDILKYEKINEPTIDFYRDFGFSILIQYGNHNKEISFTIKLGSSTSNGIGILSNNGFPINYNLGEKILKTLINSSETKLGVLKYSDVKFLKASKPYKYGLGLITYFSNNYEVQIPDDLNDIVYEYTKNGKYLILSKENFQESESYYKIENQRLIKLMEEIKQRVPEYSK